MRHIFLTGFIFCMSTFPLHTNAQSPNDEQALIEANSMSFAQDTEIVTASGDVKIQYRGREIRAGKITWDQKSDRIIASENVIFIDVDGTRITSQSAELQNEMKQATLKKFSLMKQTNLRLKGEAASRQSGQLTRVRKSVFTACKPCKNKQSFATFLFFCDTNQQLAKTKTLAICVSVSVYFKGLLQCMV